MTKEDKLFLEKFGFKWTPTIVNGYSFDGWIYPDTSHHSGELPEPTLDNLFKYCWNRAVDTLFCTGKYKSLYHAERKMHLIWVRYSNTIVDPAIALKKAIEEVING